MFDSVETFRSFAAGIQSYAIAIAVFVGGVWTAWLFRLQRRSAVSIDVRLTQLQIAESKDFHILVRAPCVRVVVASNEAVKDESKIQSIVQTASS
jgi:hypothetical protein